MLKAIKEFLKKTALINKEGKVNGGLGHRKRAFHCNT